MTAAKKQKIGSLLLLVFTALVVIGSFRIMINGFIDSSRLPLWDPAKNIRKSSELTHNLTNSDIQGLLADLNSDTIYPPGFTLFLMPGRIFAEDPVTAAAVMAGVAWFLLIGVLLLPVACRNDSIHLPARLAVFCTVSVIVMITLHPYKLSRVIGPGPDISPGTKPNFTGPWTDGSKPIPAA